MLTSLIEEYRRQRQMCIRDRSITGNDVKSMTQSLVAESVSISAPDRSSFDIKA